MEYKENMVLHLILTFFLIASAFISNKLIVHFIYPDIFVFFRMFISGILLLIIFCRDKKLFIKAKKHFFVFVLIAAFTTFLPSLFRAYALKSISASRASFWGSFEPFIASIYLYLLYDQKLTKNQFFGCLIGVFASVFFIITQSFSGNGFERILFYTADFLQIMSVVFSRYGWIKAQEILKINDFQPYQLNGFTFTISGLLALIYSFFNGTLNHFYTINWSFYLIFLLFYTLVIGNMIAYTLYGTALKKYNITLVSLAGLSVPLFVHLMGPIIFGDSLSPFFFMSVGLLFLALYVFYKK